MWLLKRVGWIVCLVIVCDGNNCSGVAIGVCGESCPFNNCLGIGVGLLYGRAHIIFI